ncbi:hypothetical protein [Candidatus Nanohalobium constans]|uniref:Phage holin family protein n=1 Tax=Candidatus Nanohalobium constans TaxID=2565781 RepID=A0A5Q0UG39_9ARCH|nr:hypothetical protein [Candidatus Nanohalobium constans]QGA80613.1 hypothetical protein LC1Nh_0725 [Candidatus Nanohalobium constans]
MALLDNLIVFIVGIIIGGLGIHFGAMFTLGRADFSKAVKTALIGAVVWSIVGFFLGGIPFLGPLITFIAWLGVIKISYEGGWINAAAIALIAWISVLIILYLLAAIGIGGFEAIGVPGV